LHDLFLWQGVILPNLTMRHDVYLDMFNLLGLKFPGTRALPEGSCVVVISLHSMRQNIYFEYITQQSPDPHQAMRFIHGKSIVAGNQDKLVRNGLPNQQTVKWVFMCQTR